MAKTYNKTANKRKSNRGRNELEVLAYKMGQIERGLANPDSKVKASYDRGAATPTQRKRKPLL